MYNLGSKFQIQADYLDTTANNVQILHGIQRGFKIFTTTTGIRKYQVKRRKKKKKKRMQRTKSHATELFVPAVS